MVREDMDETLAHDLIKLMFDNQKQLAEVHPSAEKLDARGRAEGRRAGQAAPGRRALLPGGGGVSASRHSPCSRSLAPAAAAARGRRPRRRRRRRRRGRAAARTAASRSPTATRVYRAPAEERFRAVDGGFVLDSIASPNAQVLDYYELEGERTREGGWWVLTPDHPARFDDDAARRHPPRAAHARRRRPAPAAVRARRAPASRRGGDMTDQTTTDTRPFSRDDESPSDRRDPRRVRGRAPRPQARGLPGAARRRARRRPVAVRDLLGLPAARRAGLPARVPDRRAAAHVRRLRPPQAAAAPPTGSSPRSRSSRSATRS